MSKEQITIRGIAYNVISSRTPDQAREDGLPHLAREMTKNHVRRSLYLMRPRGHKILFTYEFESGNFSDFVTL